MTQQFLSWAYTPQKIHIRYIVAPSIIAVKLKTTQMLITKRIESKLWYIYIMKYYTAMRMNTATHINTSLKHCDE